MSYSSSTDSVCLSFIDQFKVDGDERTKARIVSSINLALELLYIAYVVNIFVAKSLSKQTNFTKTMVLALLMSSILTLF